MLDAVVWVRPESSQGLRYRDQYELIGVLQIGSSDRPGECPSPRGRRARSNVWRYPGAASLPESFPQSLRSSVRVLPVALTADAMKDCTRRNGVILDPFCSAGTTIVAAEQLGRRARCAERDPCLVDVAIRRWEAMTGKRAIHAKSGLAFGAIAMRRGHKED